MRVHILLFGFLLSMYAHAQNSVVQKFLQLEIVKVNYASGNYQECISVYESENLNEILPTRDHYLIADCYQKMGQTKAARNLVHKAIVKGAKFDWLISYPELKQSFSFTDSIYFANTYQEGLKKQDFAIYSQLVSMFELDQSARRLWLKRRDSCSQDLMHQVDAKHKKILFEMIREHGWLGGNNLFLDDYFFPVFLHVTSFDSNIQEFDSLRAELQKLVLLNQLPPSTYAFWVDRYLVFNLKQPQKYGTFWRSSEEGKVLDEVQEPENIDSLRQSIGLSTLQQYKAYNSTVILPVWYKP